MKNCWILQVLLRARGMSPHAEARVGAARPGEGLPVGHGGSAK